MNPSTLPKSRDFSLPESYQNDLQTLKNLLAPCTRRAYFVGGCVRDYFLGLSSTDFDIEVYDLDEAVFAQLMEQLGAVRAGKSFHVYKWKSFDLALPRTETKTGVGHTAFATALAKEEKRASMRRDFTMNALMINIFSGDLLDFWGGLDDLQAGLLRLIDAGKFAEDSLRVLRAMQFAARFAFKVEASTVQVCRGIGLDDLSKERVFGEFEKMFRSDHPLYGLYYGIRLGIFEKLFGLSFGFRDFLILSRELKHNRGKADPMLKEYYFLYTLHNRMHIKLEPILTKLNAPTRYRRLLARQKRRPRHITDRFLRALSLHYPLREWLGADEHAVVLAKRAGVYDRAFDHGLDIQEVIKAGFEKEAIRHEYKHRVSERLRSTPR